VTDVEVEPGHLVVGRRHGGCRGNWIMYRGRFQAVRVYISSPLFCRIGKREWIRRTRLNPPKPAADHCGAASGLGFISRRCRLLCANRFGLFPRSQSIIAAPCGETGLRFWVLRNCFVSAAREWLDRRRVRSADELRATTLEAASMFAAFDSDRESPYDSSKLNK